MPPAPGDAVSMQITEVIGPNDTRAPLSSLKKAMKAGVKELLDRKNFKVILMENGPADGNVLPGRFLFAI